MTPPVTCVLLIVQLYSCIHHVTASCPPNSSLKLLGISVDYGSNRFEPTPTDHIVLNAEETYELRFYGLNFPDSIEVTFTTDDGEFGSTCPDKSTLSRDFPLIRDRYASNDTISVKTNLPKEDSDFFYVCTRINNSDFVHQGDATWLRIRTETNPLPLWARIILIIICIFISGLCSGLNLGLMALSPSELLVLSKAGTVKERKYAKTILPIRQHGNYVLCAIVFGNALFNSIFTVFLDQLTTGTVAVITATVVIVIVGEIIPQSICSRYGLKIGAKTIYFTKFLMVVTYPLACPTAWILDHVLGKDIQKLYTRQHLKQIILISQLNSGLGREEFNIISGVLDTQDKTVGDVMTKIEDAYMLDAEEVLDFDTVENILRSGYTRIPVYENDRLNVISILNIKDLALIDTADNTPVKAVCQYYQNPCFFVFENMKLLELFKIFKEGTKGHLAIVLKVTAHDLQRGQIVVGLITLEDIIEEIFQCEIIDETDVMTDNRNKHKRASLFQRDFTALYGNEKTQTAHKTRVSPHLYKATFHFLRSSLDNFKAPLISDKVLRLLLQQDVFFVIRKCKGNQAQEGAAGCYLYRRGEKADFFVMVIEGHVEVTFANDVQFQGGPFMYFGCQCLVGTVSPGDIPVHPSVNIKKNFSYFVSQETNNTHRDSSVGMYFFVPDYTVRVTKEISFLKVTAGMYTAARKATIMESYLEDNTSEEL